MKKPILYAFAAAAYIVFIVSVINFTQYLPQKETILIPMVMLGLLVLSVSVMGFLFLYEPISLYIEGKKQEALIFFGKIIGAFACFVVLLSILLLLI